MMDPGYIVLSDKTYNSERPKELRTHGTLESASDEAERLCKQEGMEFYVYKPVLKVEPTCVKRTPIL